MTAKGMALNGPRNSPPWPDPGIVLTQREISGQCICTWVVTRYSKDGESGSSLKYRDALCPAGAFHRALAGRSQPTASQS